MILAVRIVVRNVTARDAEALIDVERALTVDGRGMVTSLEQVCTIEQQRARIEEALACGDATLSVLAEIDGRVAGSAFLKQLRPMRCKHVGVLSVGVHPDFQRRGVGRALMQHLVEHARAHGLIRLELYVRSDNDRAQSLYRSLGFEHEGTRVRFMRMDDGTYIDDLIYALMLDA